MAAEFAAALLVLRIALGEDISFRDGMVLFCSGLSDDVAPLKGSAVQLLRALHSSLKAGGGSASDAADYVASVFESMRTPDDVARILDKMRARLTAARESGQADGAIAPGQAELAEVEPDSLASAALVPPLARLNRFSSMAVIVRRLLLSVDVAGFAGLARLWDSVAAEAPAVRAAVSQLQEGVPPATAASSTAAEPEQVHRRGGLLKLSPAAAREAYLRALSARDYTAAVAALHAYFDAAYGSSMAGDSSIQGSITPLGVLTHLHGDQGAPSLAGPLGRVQELLLSAASAPAVGGAAMGRNLSHYALLHLGALHLHFGHAGEAGDALQECARVSQACGDMAAASYALQLLAMTAEAEARQDGTGAGPAVPAVENAGTAAAVIPMPLMSADAVDMLQRTRQRSAELGLWRQQLAVSLALVEHASSQAAMQAAAGLHDAPSNPPFPLPLPDWLSVDPFTSYRSGGYRVGAVSPPSAGSATTAAALAHLTPEMLSPAITGSGKDGIGNAAVTAITTPSATAAAALLRRQRAAGDRRPSFGLAGATDAPGSGAGRGPAARTPTAASMWSAPLPLSWQEVVSAHGACHDAHARVWSRYADSLAVAASAEADTAAAAATATATATATALCTVAEVMRQACEACAVAARLPATAPGPAHSHSAQLDLTALLRSIGCNGV